MLREVTVKIGLEIIVIQEGVTVEVLLDNGAMELVMSLEFAKKQGFKLKKTERPIYIRNMDGTFNKKRPIEYIVEVNIYDQEHKERTEIDMCQSCEHWIIFSFSFFIFFSYLFLFYLGLGFSKR